MSLPVFKTGAPAKAGGRVRFPSASAPALRPPAADGARRRASWSACGRPRRAAAPLAVLSPASRATGVLGQAARSAPIVSWESGCAARSSFTGFPGHWRLGQAARSAPDCLLGERLRRSQFFHRLPEPLARGLRLIRRTQKAEFRGPGSPSRLKVWGDFGAPGLNRGLAGADTSLGSILRRGAEGLGRHIGAQEEAELCLPAPGPRVPGPGRAGTPGTVVALRRRFSDPHLSRVHRTSRGNGLSSLTRVVAARCPEELSAGVRCRGYPIWRCHRLRCRGNLGYVDLFRRERIGSPRQQCRREFRDERQQPCRRLGLGLGR